MPTGELSVNPCLDAGEPGALKGLCAWVREGEVLQVGKCTPAPECQRAREPSGRLPGAPRAIASDAAALDVLKRVTSVSAARLYPDRG